MDDRRVCPHCGKPINPQPYLMSRDPDAQWPIWGKPAVAVVIGLALAPVAHLLFAHLA